MRAVRERAATATSGYLRCECVFGRNRMSEISSFVETQSAFSPICSNRCSCSVQHTASWRCRGHSEASKPACVPLAPAVAPPLPNGSAGGVATVCCFYGELWPNQESQNVSCCRCCCCCCCCIAVALLLLLLLLHCCCIVVAVASVCCSC